MKVTALPSVHLAGLCSLFANLSAGVQQCFLPAFGNSATSLRAISSSEALPSINSKVCVGTKHPRRIRRRVNLSEDIPRLVDL